MKDEGRVWVECVGCGKRWLVRPGVKTRCVNCGAIVSTYEIGEEIEANA